MKELSESRRRFLKAVGLTAGAVFLSSGSVVAESSMPSQSGDSPAASPESGSADYTLHIKTSPVEIAPNRIISATTYPECAGIATLTGHHGADRWLLPESGTDPHPQTARPRHNPARPQRYTP